MLYIFDPQTIIQIPKSKRSDGLKLCDGRREVICANALGGKT